MYYSVAASTILLIMFWILALTWCYSLIDLLCLTRANVFLSQKTKTKQRMLALDTPSELSRNKYILTVIGQLAAFPWSHLGGEGSILITAEI